MARGPSPKRARQETLAQNSPGFTPPEAMALTQPTPAEVAQGLGATVEAYTMELIPKAEASLLSLLRLPSAAGGLGSPQGRRADTRVSRTQGPMGGSGPHRDA